MVIVRNKMITKYRSEFDLKADLIRTHMNSTKPYRLAVITGVNYVIIMPYITAFIDEGLLTVTNDSLYVPTEKGISLVILIIMRAISVITAYTL